MKKDNKKTKLDNGEVWMRIPVFIVSGIILNVWGFFILCFAIAQLILILLEGKRNKELLEMCNIYLIQIYVFIKYVVFLSEERPFPFGNLKKEIEKSK